MKSQNWTYAVVMSLLAALAMPVWTVAQDNPSPDHKPKHKKYKLIDLGTLGGPNSYPIIAESVQTLSQDGVVAGCAETSQPNLKYPNFNPFLYPPPQPDPSIAHAFQSHNSSLTDLGALPGANTSCALWISDNGLIAGASENGVIDPLTGWPEIEAILWRHGQLTGLGNLGGNESFPVSVNNRGQVTGFATNAIPDDIFGFGTQVRAFLWEKGRMRDLGTLGGPDAFGIVVNDRGQVLGFSLTATGNGDGFLWENGRMQDIPDALGGTQINPFYLNNQGMAIGNASLAGDQAFHPFLWYRGVMRDLGTFGGDNGGAVWVNDVGQVVGTADLPGSTTHHAFFWNGRAKLDLGTVNGDLCSRAFAINSSSQIVGTSSDCVTAKSAVLWEKGTGLDLNQLVDSNSSLTLIRAWNINDRGEIAAEGLRPNGDEHAVLLVPKGDCDDDCERRIDASQSNAVGAAAPVAFSSTTSNQANTPLSTVERFRSMMRQRYRILGQPAAPRD